VFVAVQDSGIGVDQQNMGRLFEPFCTTKPEGMGLGFADQPLDYRGAWRPIVGHP
jgi:nitrogen fixation/metabolism regulation signal transduction histidine kinase